MAAIHETAYPRIKPNLSHKEQQEIFTPTVVSVIIMSLIDILLRSVILFLAAPMKVFICWMVL